jgi:hypothetical protein
MRITYLSSLFPAHTMTFVFSEVQAHCNAGVDVLALSCDPAPQDDVSRRVKWWRCPNPLAAEAQTLLERTVAPPSSMARLHALVREAVCHPHAMLRNLAWAFGLLFIDPIEFLIAVREMGTAAYMAPACRAHSSFTCTLLVVR